VFPSFRNEDRTSLMNFCRFVAPDEFNCFLCCVYGNDGDLYHLSQNCPLLLDGYQCFECFGPHCGVDCHDSIPHSLNNCPNGHLLHDERTLGNVPLHEGMVLIAWVRYGVNGTKFFFGPYGIATH
jgi:hypothetical protein